VTTPAGAMCGVCGATLRANARFCGRCGGEQGLMVARDAGAGPELREPTPPAPPLDGRALVIALTVYATLLVPTLYLLARARGPSLFELDMVEWLAGVAGVLGMIALGRDALRGLGLPRASVRGVALAIVATAGVVVALRAMQAAFPSAFVDDAILMRVFGLGTLGTLLHVAVIPALTEELAFRGAVLAGLRGVFSDRSAIVVSAMMFAIWHMAVPSLVHLTLLGLVLAAVRVRSGSLWPCVLIHAGYNATIILMHW